MTNEAMEFMKNNPVLYLATVDESGNPKIRPFMFMLEKDGKPYFCTSNKKPMYAQMKNHPNVEITTASPEFAWIRISAKISFSNDLEIKKAVIASSPLVKGIYQTAENPDFAIFTLADATAVIADFSGNPPKTYRL
ncbi:pyridoxamine 5'-phosphate oxidase family protein [Methanorbis rubei]